MKRHTARIALVAGVGLTLAALSAGPASAADAAGAASACPSGRVCFYFNSDLAGARADYVYSDRSLDDELFTDGPSGANGWGIVVNNNAASVRNNLAHTVYLYDLPGCQRVDPSLPQKAVAPGGWGNLALLGLKNKVSSIRVLDGSACIERDQTWA